MTISGNSEFVSISATLIDKYLATINSIGLAAAIEDIEGILANIDDSHNCANINDVLQISGKSLQDMMIDIELVLPFYLDLLRPALIEFQSEGYLELTQAKQLLGVPESEELRLTPKLLISDDTKGFAYLQIAGCQAKLSDEYVVLWYRILLVMLMAEKNMQDQTVKH